MARFFLVFVFLLLCLSGCGKAPTVRMMEATAYCGCAQCCGWTRGSWLFLNLDFWNRYIAYGPHKGKYYSGLTASGTDPQEPEEGLFSLDSLQRPWMIPPRIIFFPWMLLPEDGTIAADTRYYPFGTRMHIPGWGWGTVEDRGSAIKGRDRIDLFFDSHEDALLWGRRRVQVTIEYQ